MVRTVISLEADEKAWLDRKARELGKPMTSLVRDAVALLRAEDARRGKVRFEVLLERTRGIWTRGDGLEWQDQVRAEWGER